jgi:hypothetical protein
VLAWPGAFIGIVERIETKTSLSKPFPKLDWPSETQATLAAKAASYGDYYRHVLARSFA